MAAQSRHIALLLFLRDEAQEALVKPMAEGRRTGRAVVHQLNRYARRQARLSGLPLFVIQGRRQAGNTFGERLANAFEYVFARGYDGVLAMGNDCLALNAGSLRQAASHLMRSDAVLGPARDGGVYLLGLRRRAYRRSSFIGLPWQTNRVFDSLCQYTAQWGLNASWLREEEDADDGAALQRLLGPLPLYHYLRRVLEDLLTPSARPSFSPAPLRQQGRYLACLQRGPPI